MPTVKVADGVLDGSGRSDVDRFHALERRLRCVDGGQDDELDQPFPLRHTLKPQ